MKLLRVVCKPAAKTGRNAAHTGSDLGCFACFDLRQNFLLLPFIWDKLLLGHLQESDVKDTLPMPWYLYDAPYTAGLHFVSLYIHTSYTVLRTKLDERHTKLNSNTTTPNPRSNLDFAEVEKNHGFEIWTHTSFVR